MNAEPTSTLTTAEAEPTSAFTPVPVWVFVAFFLAFFCAAVAFDRNGGWWFDPKLYSPYRSPEDLVCFRPAGPPNPLESGRRVYETTCALCHQPDGMGKPGQFPPLVGSEWVNAQGDNRIVLIPLFGLAGPIDVKGQQGNQSMTALGGSLRDQQIADALSYVRNTWGNKAPFVPVEKVKAARAEFPNRTQPMTADELKKRSE